MVRRIVGNADVRCQLQARAAVIDHEVKVGIQLQVWPDLGEEVPQHRVGIVGGQQHRCRFPQQAHPFFALSEGCAGLLPQPGHLNVCTDTSQKFSRAEWLHEIVVSPGLHPLDPAFLAGTGREHDDGQPARAWVRPQRFQ